MGKAKPIEQNKVLQRIIEYLKQHEQSFPEQIARAVGCNSQNIIYYVDRYPELFSVERLGGNHENLHEDRQAASGRSDSSGEDAVEGSAGVWLIW